MNDQHRSRAWSSVREVRDYHWRPNFNRRQPYRDYQRHPDTNDYCNYQGQPYNKRQQHYKTKKRVSKSEKERYRPKVSSYTPVENRSSDSHAYKPVFYDNIANTNQAPMTNPDIEDFVRILVLGHSFVTRLDQEIYEDAVAQEVCYQEAMELRGSRIIPSLVGKAGLMINELKKLDDLGTKERPNIIILELGQNDVCWSAKTPRQYAKDLKRQLNRLFRVYNNLELIAIPKVTHKTIKIYESNQWKYTDKPLVDLNKDIDTFNLEIFRNTRKDRRVIRWHHQGTINPDVEYSTDGTHMDSGSGVWKHRRSITQLCRWAKDALIDRRTLSKAALERKMRKEKIERRLKKSKKWQEIGGKIVKGKWIQNASPKKGKSYVLSGKN